MPGKRPRQIQRTTSLSQLGPGFQLLDGTPMVPARPKTPSPPGALPVEHPPIVPPPCLPVEDVPIEDFICEGVENGTAQLASSSQQPSEYAAESMALDIVEEHPLMKQFEEAHAVHQVVVTPVAFLEVCFLCKRRLRQGKDIYMYRGDRAFCSIECRCHQIEADERTERCKITSVKKETGAPAATSGSTSQQVVPKETAAAA